MELLKPAGVIKQNITPEEMAIKLITKNWKNILEKLDEKDQERIQQDLVNILYSAIDLERATTDKFIELTANDVGVVGYYLYLLDKVKYMATEAFVENSKKKRDLLLVEMSKILGANVVEETIPVPYKIKEVL
jgi:ribonucleotide reductase beta subunit family protein with ferritin-like domain